MPGWLLCGAVQAVAAGLFFLVPTGVATAALMVVLNTVTVAALANSGTMAGHHLAATCRALQQAAEADDLEAANTLALAVERQTKATCQMLRASLTAGS